MRFADRAAAGRQLAAKLAHLKDAQPVILALPRGGVGVGFEIAQALGAPLDIVLVRKIGVPWQPELALAPSPMARARRPLSMRISPGPWTYRKAMRGRDRAPAPGDRAAPEELLREPPVA